MPASTKAVIDTFMQADDFLTFYICALICGSILGIEARLLVKAGARYVVPLTAAVARRHQLRLLPDHGRRHGGRGHSHG